MLVALPLAGCSDDSPGAPPDAPLNDTADAAPDTDAGMDDTADAAPDIDAGMDDTADAAPDIDAGGPVFASTPAPAASIPLSALVGASDTATIEVQNHGTADLTVAPGGLSGAVSVAPTTEQTVAAGDSVMFTITCAPEAATTSDQTLTLSTNDPGAPTNDYSVSCNGELADPGSAAFSYVGAAQSFVVPLGVLSVTVEACGGQGGDGASDPDSPDGGAGGKGGCITATIPVTPGETLGVFVGDQGADGKPVTLTPPAFNGGGGGGGIAILGGGGGGGASDVRQGGNALVNRVVVAGGGGGGGATRSDDPGGNGGAGGDLTAAAGEDVRGATGGEGGTQTGGGAGGVNETTGARAPSGTLGIGGNSGDDGNNGGGAGGGGYYGGGGAAESSLRAVAPGGGGGSSFAIPTATGVTYAPGTHTGQGSVTITY